MARPQTRGPALGGAIQGSGSRHPLPVRLGFSLPVVAFSPVAELRPHPVLLSEHAFDLRLCDNAFRSRLGR